jgi:hypothetical protein
VAPLPSARDIRSGIRTPVCTAFGLRPAPRWRDFLDWTQKGRRARSGGCVSPRRRTLRVSSGEFIRSWCARSRGPTHRNRRSSKDLRERRAPLHAADTGSHVGLPLRDRCAGRHPA